MAVGAITIIFRHRKKSRRDFRVGLYEIDALIDQVKEKERRAMEDAKQEGPYDQI